MALINQNMKKSTYCNTILLRNSNSFDVDYKIDTT